MKLISWVSLATVAATLGLTGTAKAEGESPAAVDKGAHAVSLTLDPWRIAFGLPMVSGEVALSRRFSLGGWLGLGRVRESDQWWNGDMPIYRSDCDALHYCDHATVFWTGAQALFYPVGSFDHGMQLGAEASFMRVSGTRRYTSFHRQLSREVAAESGSPSPTLADRDVQGTAFRPGAVIGYKLATRIGFTFNPQLAADLVISEAPVKVEPRLALNVGWSF